MCSKIHMIKGSVFIHEDDMKKCAKNKDFRRTLNYRYNQEKAVLDKLLVEAAISTA